MTGRLRIVAGVALVTVVAGVALVPRFLAGSRPFGPRSGGPIDPVAAHGYSIDAKPGQSFTGALDLVRLRSGPPGTILSVTPVYASRHFSTVGVWASGSDRSHEAAVVMSSYLKTPPDDPKLGTIRQAAGAPIVSRKANPWQTQLLIGTHVSGKGTFVRRGYYLTYRVGHVRYRECFPAEIKVCSGRVNPQDWC